MTKLLITTLAHIGVAAWVARELRAVRKQVVKLHWCVEEATQPYTEQWVQNVRITETQQPFDRFDSVAHFSAALSAAKGSIQ